MNFICFVFIFVGSQSPIKVCERAFLFPFPVYESPVRPLVDTSDFPPQPSEQDSVIGERWFLVKDGVLAPNNMQLCE